MERDKEIKRFLVEQGLAQATCVKMTGDASARRYMRVTDKGRSMILMDAPPQSEKIHPFLDIARLLNGMKLRVPHIYAADITHGLILLEDFGDMTFTRALAQQIDESKLYRLAVGTLVDLHRRLPVGFHDMLPAHDDARCLREVSLLLDWYWPAVFSVEASINVREGFEEAWREILPLRHALPPSIALFDFHVDNLMVLGNPLDELLSDQCGLLDFQDAVIAPLGFDLASLLEDVRRDVPAAIKSEMQKRYLRAFPDIHIDDFMAAYHVMAAQRNVRIVGTFARLLCRDGKPAYQQFMPRVWRLVGDHLSYPSLAPLKRWFDMNLPPSKRISLKDIDHANA